MSTKAQLQSEFREWAQSQFAPFDVTVVRAEVRKFNRSALTPEPYVAAVLELGTSVDPLAGEKVRFIDGRAEPSRAQAKKLHEVGNDWRRLISTVLRVNDYPRVVDATGTHEPSIGFQFIPQQAPYGPMARAGMQVGAVVLAFYYTQDFYDLVRG